MSFPNPIKLPKSIDKAREERIYDLFRVILIGVFFRCLIIALELFGYYHYDSSVLLLDAIATMVDMVSSVVLMVFLYLACKPPDRQHPFGHGRLEPIIGLQLALFLVIMGSYLTVDQLSKTGIKTVEEPLSNIAWLVPAVAIVLLVIAFKVMMSVATKRESEALKSEAEHYRIDAITTFVAMCVLLAGSFFPYYSNYLDHAGALLIAIFMILLGLKAAKGNFEQLMDKKPKAKYFSMVRAAAMETTGVKGTEKIRIQLYGPDAHVDIDIEVDPHLSVEKAHVISQKVRAEIQKKLPEVRDVTVHIEPFYPGDHV